MSKAKHWIPIYIGDFLSDTSQLTCEQRGAYLLLLFHQWRNGSVPDDPVQVAQICGIRQGRYARVAKPVIEQYFHLGQDMLWRNARCAVLQDSAESRYIKASAKARQASVLRWKTPKNSDE